jgi:hypothetical protein
MIIWVGVKATEALADTMARKKNILEARLILRGEEICLSR